MGNSNDGYRIALYDVSDPDPLHPKRVMFSLPEVPVVGSTVRVPDTISIYHGTLASCLCERFVRIVGVLSLSERKKHWYMQRAGQAARDQRNEEWENTTHHFYVQIADPFERLAVEKLRRLYFDLGGSVDSNIISLFDYVLLPQTDGRELIAALMTALDEAGFPPATVLKWYKWADEPAGPSWLRPYLQPA